MKLKEYLADAVNNLNDHYCGGAVEYELQYGYGERSFYVNISHLGVPVYKEYLISSNDEANEARFFGRIMNNLFTAGIVKIAEMHKESEP